MVSEVEVEAKRHCCCRLRMWARKVIWRERREIVRRCRVISLDICVLPYGLRGKAQVNLVQREEDNFRVNPRATQG